MSATRATTVLVLGATLIAGLAGCLPIDPGTSPRTSLKDGATQSDALLSALIPTGGPGCSGAVTIDGELVWAGQSGLADVESGIAIGPTTRFDIASVSKQFTGLVTLRLAEAGTLTLGDPLDTHLGGLPDWASSVTIDDLLHHTSGIPDYTGLLLDAGFSFEETTRQSDALDALANTELEFGPGERFSYSNSNYVLLASIIEAVTGEGFGIVLEREAFGDADLRLEPAPAAPDVAISYEGGAESHPGWLQVGDGSIVASASELARWGAIYARTTDPTVQAMTEGAVDDGAGGHYGAGIGIQPDGSLVHSGAWAGFVTLFGVSADRSTVIALSCNSPDLALEPVSSGLLEIWT